MDDAWLHTLSTSPAPSSEARAEQHRRKPSLLQQPAEPRAEIAVDPIAETLEEDDPWRGPPLASPARRAQSYSDFYDVVHAIHRKEHAVRSKRSWDNLRQTAAVRHAELEFNAEFATMEDHLLDESHTRYRAYHEQLQLSQSHLDNLLSTTSDTLKLLLLLSGSFQAVEAQTDAFREQCESLLTEQKRLTTIANGIEENSKYYAYLEPITRRLNAPGAANLVKGHDFPELLSNLDMCLAYMETHTKHAESATYRSRYRLLLTRGLTLVRHYFTKSLGDLAAEISKRIQGGQLKDSTHSTLLYAKFRVPAPELKMLGLEIQKRAVPTPEDVDAGREPEYASLMRELYQSYSTTRGRLMLPLVSKRMTELTANPQYTEVLALAKAALSYMRGVCLDEHDLWFEWFETGGDLYDFLENLMDPMYDHLRPRIIHETKLEKLCELCSVIQGQYMDTGSDDEDDGPEFARSQRTNGHPPHRRLDFASLVQPALQDAQTRLVFLALAVLRDGIENYRPTADDLDWPKVKQADGAKSGPVLSGTRSTVPPALSISEDAEGLADDVESVLDHKPTHRSKRTSDQTWYPTLPKAIWLLRRIYRLVNSTVFDDLAHRIVHSTILSLLSASSQISKKKTTQDGLLFLITHLLHLKQQIVAFDIEFVPPEVEFDFSSVTNPFYELRDRGGLWNPVSWVKLVGGTVGGGLLPKVVENMLDAKAELDGRLRTAINDLVNGYADHITAPIEPSTIVKAKASAEGFDAVKAMRTVRGLAEKEVPGIRSKLEQHVKDSRTRETLVAAVRDQVMASYEDFFDNYSDGRSRKVSRKGKAREDEVWSTDLFGEVLEDIFHVGQVFGTKHEDSGDEGQVSE